MRHNPISFVSFDIFDEMGWKNYNILNTEQHIEEDSGKIRVNLTN